MVSNIKFPLLLDGGLSNQLEHQGCDLKQSLWTAKLLKSDPNAIVNAHKAFLEAGSQCLISASYQASIPGFQTIGIEEPEARALIIKSVDLANEAIDQFMESIQMMFVQK